MFQLSAGTFSVMLEQAPALFVLALSLISRSHVMHSALGKWSREDASGEEGRVRTGKKKNEGVSPGTDGGHRNHRKMPGSIREQVSTGWSRG